MYDSLGRPYWDDWFMTLCYVISQRSMDPTTKHGTVVIDEDKTILAVGFNGPPRGCNDHIFPMTRPEKYGIMLHSEEAAIANAARSGVSLKGSTFYVTGHPCEKCFRLILNVGAKKICHGHVSSHCINDDSRKHIENMLVGQPIEIQYIQPDVLDLLKRTEQYYLQKANT